MPRNTAARAGVGAAMLARLLDHPDEWSKGVPKGMPATRENLIKNQVNLLVLRGESLAFLNRKDEGRVCFKKALALDPGNTAAQKDPNDERTSFVPGFSFLPPERYPRKITLPSPTEVLIGSRLTSARTTSSWTSTETTKSYQETDREEGNYPRRTI